MAIAITMAAPTFLKVNMKLLNQQETSMPNPVVVGNEAINDYIENELRSNVKEKISALD